MIRYPVRFLPWLAFGALLLAGQAVLVTFVPSFSFPIKPLSAAMLAPALPSTCTFTRYDVMAPGNTGIQLDTTVRVPVISSSCVKPAAGWPLIVSVPQYAGDKRSVTLHAVSNVQAGYISVAFSWRGMGNSTGTFAVLTRSEWEDLRALTNWVLNTYVVTAPIVNRNRIGIEGDSMGGAVSWIGATQGMGFRDAVPTNASPYVARDLTSNGCMDNGVALFFNPADGVRWDAATQAELWNDYVNPNDVNPLRNFFSGSERNFSQDLNQTSAYVFGNASWTDLFQFAPALIAGYAQDPLAPKRIYLASNGHENYFEFSDVNYLEEVHRMGWHAHWLQDAANGIETGGPISFLGYLSGDPLVATNHISSTDTAAWPPVGVISTTLFLRKGGALTVLPPGPAEGADTITNSLLDSSYTMTQAVHSEVPPFSLTFTKIPTSSVVYTSPVLAQPVWWYGEPSLTSYTAADGPNYNLPTLFYDVELDSQGQEVSSYLITRAQSCWQAGDSATRTYLGLDMARRLAAGHVVRVVYQNVDPETSGPGFVGQRIRPYFGNFVEQVEHNLTQPSSLTLPLKPDNPALPIFAPLIVGTPTFTPSPTPSPTATSTASPTATASSTSTPTASSSPTFTPTATATATGTPGKTATSTPTPTLGGPSSTPTIASRFTLFLPLLLFGAAP